jgi:zinc transport system substrate-binding protein
MRYAALLAISLAAAGAPALADPPGVATDIPPVHSLVARVMLGVAEPGLVLPPGASPHDYAMRPSEAAALDGAELIVWMGPGLTPWLARAVDTLAGDARSLPLLEVEGTTILQYRDGPAFDSHPAPQAGEDAHASDAHAHGAADPHAWLDPENAKLWLGAIADALAQADPGNAGAYRDNAEAARAEIDALSAELSEKLEPLRGKPFIVYHDAYHYFGHHFGIEAAGAIAPTDAAPPGPARISAIRELIARTGAACVFAEPQFPADLIATVIEDSGARAATLDPLGATLEPGPELYPRMLRHLATALRDCLDPAA